MPIKSSHHAECKVQYVGKEYKVSLVRIENDPEQGISDFIWGRKYTVSREYQSPEDYTLLSKYVYNIFCTRKSFNTKNYETEEFTIIDVEALQSRKAMVNFGQIELTQTARDSIHYHYNSQRTDVLMPERYMMSERYIKQNSSRHHAQLSQYAPDTQEYQDAFVQCWQSDKLDIYTIAKSIEKFCLVILM